MKPKAVWIVTILTASLCYTATAQAQWVFLGRKAVGAINRLTSPGTEKQGQGYDVATVLLEASADRVYGAAVDLLMGKPNITVDHRHDAGREIEFTDGKVVVGLKVSSLEDNLSQLLITSNAASGRQGSTSFLIERVIQICEKAGVHCALAKD